LLLDDEKQEGPTLLDHGPGSVPDRVTERLTVAGLVWRQRSFLLKFVLVCVVLTAVGVFVWPSKYQSTVSMMPPSSRANSLLTGMLAGKLDSDVSSFAGDAFGFRSKGALYISILGSRNVQDAIINRFDLRKVYREKYMKDARKDLDKCTEASEDRKSGIITVTVTDRDRYRASEIAAAYVQELNRVSVDNNNSSAHLERMFLERRLDEVNQDLRDSTARLAQFSSKNMTLDIATQGKAMMEASTALQGKLIAAEAELSGLRQTYTDSNPRVIALQASVSELQRQLNIMSTGTHGTSGQIYPSLRELPSLDATYEDLSRRVKIEVTVADLLTRQYEIAKVEEAKELPVVQLLDAPDVAEKRVSPKRGTIIVSSVVFYLALGVLLILLEAYWQSLDSSHSKKLLAAELAGYGRQLLPGRSKNTST